MTIFWAASGLLASVMNALEVYVLISPSTRVKSLPMNV